MEQILELAFQFVPDYKTLTRLKLVNKKLSASVDIYYRNVRAYPARFYYDCCPRYIIKIEEFMTKCVSNTDILVMHT